MMLSDYERPGTHITHCCEIHGCKYNKECPVEDKVAIQAYLCEYCRTPEELRQEISDLQAQLEWVVALETKQKEENNVTSD